MYLPAALRLTSCADNTLPGTVRSVRDSVIDTGDDGLCPKATPGNGPVRNLTAHNLWIRSKSCAIKFGSTTDDEMHDMLFENITIVDSNRGLGIQQRG